MITDNFDGDTEEWYGHRIEEGDEINKSKVK